MTPFTNSTPENFEDGCIYHCEDYGWLPADGETDQIDGLNILWPTEYSACPCNPLYSMNDEMEVAHVD